MTKGKAAAIGSAVTELLIDMDDQFGAPALLVANPEGQKVQIDLTRNEAGRYGVLISTPGYTTACSIPELRVGIEGALQIVSGVIDQSIRKDVNPQGIQP